MQVLQFAASLQVLQFGIITCYANSHNFKPCTVTYLSSSRMNVTTHTEQTCIVVMHMLPLQSMQ